MIALDIHTTKRFFFNFVSDDECIDDETGIELAAEGDVMRHIARALEDLYQDSSLAAAEWEGWRIVVTDGAGQTMLSFALGDSCRQGHRALSMIGNQGWTANPPGMRS
jgi:hypothetical protein